MVVQQLVDQLDDVVGGFAELPGVERDGQVQDVVLPPGKRMAAVMACWPRVRVTSVSSRRMRRLRSRAGVAGLFQRAGKSAARAWMRARWEASSVTAAVLAAV